MEQVTLTEPTATAKTLKFNNYSIAYFVAGEENENTIVFLHPAFSDHRAFNQQVNHFSKEYRVITVDLLGHGLSKPNSTDDKIDISSEHILKILEAENVEKAHVAGVSLGSLVGQYFALNYPNKVASITNVGGHYINEVNPEIEKAQKSFNTKLILRAIFSMNAFKSKVAKTTCSSKEGQAYFHKTTELFERSSLSVLEGLQNVISTRKDTQPQCPQLILVGDGDLDIVLKTSQEWNNASHNSTFIEVKNAGHCVNIDQPMIFNNHLENFIKAVSK